ncbi:helix-turn-helix domain-containing protein [Plectonema radiosum]|uniref:helix-turn-helix domain-containing protein n=1 Tax=Plectonema radiosum TaxID=945768 RepID=UPI002981A069|nr:helix-turn-helix domain-containing protein [Plectonema radiosum]
MERIWFYSTSPAVSLTTQEPNIAPQINPENRKIRLKAVKMRLAYQYRIRPTKQQIATFEHWLELCRRQYNYRLAERFNWRDFGLTSYTKLLF